MASPGFVTSQTQGTQLAKPCGESTTVCTRPSARSNSSVCSRCSPSNQLLVAELRRQQVARHLLDAVLHVGDAFAVAHQPGRELEMHRAQLAAGRSGASASMKRRHSSSRISAAGPRSRACAAVRPERLLQVLVQHHGLRLVAGEEAEGLDVEDEVFRRALGPQLRVLRRGHAVVAGVHLDQRELLRVEAQALLGRLAGRRIEAAAGDQRLVGPGGGADEDVRSTVLIYSSSSVPCSTPTRSNPSTRSSARRPPTAPATARGDTRPLLVIAGAGSGKTNTLAHRVANLIRHGADPQRMMLLTFSRRAAQEMERRVGGVLQQALGLPAHAGAAQPALERHLPRHRRAAAARVRAAHRPGGDLHHPRPRRRRRPDGHGAPRDRPVGNEEALSAQGHLPGHLLARAQHARSARRWCCRTLYPWCSQWEDELKKLFGAYVEAKQQQNVLDYDDLLACSGPR